MGITVCRLDVCAMSMHACMHASYGSRPRGESNSQGAQDLTLQRPIYLAVDRARAGPEEASK